MFVGMVSGFMAYVFAQVVHLAKKSLLYDIGGYAEPHIIKGATVTFWGPMWGLIAIVAAGALISGIVVYLTAPEAMGDGTDYMIHSFHTGRIKSSITTPVIKALASALVIGTGGSAGKEGPISQIGAGVAGVLSSVFRLTDREKRMFTLAGAGAGVGAIFKAPIGGAIFAAEVLYRSAELETEALTHIIVASIAAYVVYGLFDTWSPIFTTPSYQFSIIHVPVFALMGFFMIPFGYFYSRLLRSVHTVFTRSMIPRFLTPFLGAIVVGFCIAVIPAVSSDGYGWVQEMLNEHLGLKMLIVFALLKIVATSFTLGAGASGGLYAPSFAIGAALGGVYGHLLKIILPNIQISTGAFVLVGMGSFFACVAKVPLATIIMIAELTGNYDLLVPITAASFFSFFFSGNWTIYEAQVYSKKDSQSHRQDFMVDVLDSITVMGATHLPQDRITLRPDMTIEDVFRLATSTGRQSFPVMDIEGNFLGLVYMDDLRAIMHPGTRKEMHEIVMVNDLVRDDVPVLKPSDTLHKALTYFIRSGVEELPVLSDEGDFLGTISHSELIAAYERAVSSYNNSNV